MSLTDANDDWIESVRYFLYPRLHDHLVAVGEALGTPLYAVGSVSAHQYVGSLEEAEDAIEEELVAVGFQRNPFAAFKRLADGRQSEGSWVLRHEAAPDLIESGMQLHITLFARPGDMPGRQLHAHYEDDWRDAAVAHLRGANFDVHRGVELAENYLNEETFLTLHN